MSDDLEPGRDPVAEAWVEAPGRMSLGQARLLLKAAQWAKMDDRELATVVVKVTGADDPETLSPDDLARVMDRFVAAGFRHPSIPMVTAAQLACLDEGRRRLGLNGRQYVAAIRQISGVRSRRQLDGVGFMSIWKLFNDHGAGVSIPHPGFMCRRTIGLLHQAAHSCGMTPDTLMVWRMSLGGVPSLGWIDERAFFRLLAVFDRLGVALPVPAPIVSAEPGMATQPQANLIWKLWHDIGGWDGDTSEAALDRAIASMLGLPGGLATLTRAGARSVIDRLLVPPINDRLAEDATWERPDDRPQDKMIHDDKQRAKRARRRGRPGRR